MTKTIAIGTFTLAVILFLTLSFKSAENEKKEYVSIYFNTSGKDITLSYSNGTFKKIEMEKQQGICDQTQLLRIINEHETLGFKLMNCETKFPVNVYTYVATALLVK